MWWLLFGELILKHNQSDFLNQAYTSLWLAPGFLELLLSMNVCMRAYVCVSAPEAINN